MTIAASAAFATTPAAVITATTPAPPTCVPLDARLVGAAGAANHLGVVFVTFANDAQADFALNWHAHLAALELASSALVGATDATTEHTLIRAGVRCFPLRSSLGRGEAKWGSDGFSHMGRTKAKLLRTLLELHATVLFADIDVVFLRDPLPYVGRQLAAGAHLLFHTDGFGSSDAAKLTQPEGLEEPSFGLTPELNTGLFLATPNASGLARAWCEALDADGAFSNWKNDQQSLNGLVRRGLRMPPPPANGRSTSASASKLMAAFDGTLRLGLLPNHLFPFGHVFFLQRALRNASAPLAVHLTFQNCDQSGKRHRMREAGVWIVDPPSYYEPEGGILSYEPDLPAELTDGRFAPLERNMRLEDPLVQAHFRLINHQLLQVRTALALAQILNRTLVLPRLLCGVETVTNFAHKGVRCVGSNGCGMALPYWCPADHVLRMHYLRGVMPQTPKLPVRYREFSLLANAAARREALRKQSHPQHQPTHPLPQQEQLAAAASRLLEELPSHEPSSTLLVHVKGSPARQCDGCVPSTPDTYVAARPLQPTPRSLGARADHRHELGADAIDEADFIAALRPYRHLRHVHFDSLRPDGLRVRLAPKTLAPFEETIRYLGGGFCCVEAAKRGGFGHFWYDLLWDQPHTDRWGRQFTVDRPYTPIPGP